MKRGDFEMERGEPAMRSSAGIASPAAHDPLDLTRYAAFDTLLESADRAMRQWEALKRVGFNIR